MVHLVSNGYLVALFITFLGMLIVVKNRTTVPPFIRYFQLPAVFISNDIQFPDILKSLKKDIRPTMPVFFKRMSMLNIHLRAHLVLGPLILVATLKRMDQTVTTIEIISFNLNFR